MTFENKVNMVLEELKHTLVSKNKKYGNSALDPVRVFSKASPKEQILVRLDDKLSRLRTQHVSEDEDVITDLMGYLVLLRLADMQDPTPIEETTQHIAPKGFDFEEPLSDENVASKVRIWLLLNKSPYTLRHASTRVIILDPADDSLTSITFNSYEEFLTWVEKDEDELAYTEYLSGKQEIEVRELLRTTPYYVVSWGVGSITIGIRGGDTGVTLANYEGVMEWYNNLTKDKK